MAIDKKVKSEEKVLMFEGESVTCPFCGQSRILTHNVMVQPNAEDNDARIVGAMECGCGDAREFQQCKKNKDNVPTIIDDFLNFCEAENISDAASAVDCIRNACFAIIDGAVNKIVITFKEVKMKMVLNSDKQLEMKTDYKKGFTRTT